MHLIGKRRNARETYPEANRASAALQNRLIATPPQSPGSPFTPAGGLGSLIAAAVVRPVSSGVFMLFGNILIANGADAGNYTAAVVQATGTGLTVTGGVVDFGGWTFGSNTPPVIGGTPVSGPPMAVWSKTFITDEFDSLGLSGVNSTPLPIGVDSVMQILLAGSGSQITELAVEVSLIELP